MAKTCFDCGKLKDLSEFYVHPSMADGHLGKCKECVRGAVRANRRKNVAYYREYDVKRFREDPERRKRVSESSNKRRMVVQGMNASHSAVAKAIKRGVLVRHPCDVCGREDSHAHHDDYSKPLDVRWLCPPHHREVHGGKKF